MTDPLTDEDHAECWDVIDALTAERAQADRARENMQSSLNIMAVERDEWKLAANRQFDERVAMQSQRDAAEAERDRYRDVVVMARERVRTALNELGMPGPEYPTPVSVAHEELIVALGLLTETEYQ